MPSSWKAGACPACPVMRSSAIRRSGAGWRSCRASCPGVPRRGCSRVAGARSETPAARGFRKRDWNRRTCFGLPYARSLWRRTTRPTVFERRDQVRRVCSQVAPRRASASGSPPPGSPPATRHRVTFEQSVPAYHAALRAQSVRGDSAAISRSAGRNSGADGWEPAPALRCAAWSLLFDPILDASGIAFGLGLAR